ncbi:MAG: helix-turn-helix domain-containing protein [Tistlia sp.]|uniref:TetR/AcrR family transcriptional regulator n=1 Tax=Tistlia sp. TaxID=3057121 RepID=UPI0034A4A873
MGAALALFWRQGYEQTSLEELTAAMGISRSSFYACFGSKHEALLAAAGRYCEDNLRALDALAGAEADPALAARAVVEAIAAPEGGRHGCFLANCVTELAPHDPEIEALVRRQLARTEALLAGLLRRSAPGDSRSEDRAAALLSLALGATMLRKAGTPPERLRVLLTQADRLISP